MTRKLPIVALAFALSGLSLSSAHAGGTGYAAAYRSGHCAESKFQTPRYNQSLPYRHYEDRRRYNAAPCAGEVIAVGPHIVKTVIVSKKMAPHYYYDSRGHRHCRKVLTIVYKDIYSDGSCYVWAEHA